MNTPQHIIAGLRAAWEQPGAGRNPYSSRALRPIAHGPEDQITPDGTENPLWDIVRWMPAEPGPGGGLRPTAVHDAFPSPLATALSDMGASRHHLTTRYAWSIPTPGDIRWIAEQLGGRAVVEIGAGTGYWAWQMEQAGIGVAAYDPHPVAHDNTYCKAGPYSTVRRDDATAVKHHADRALLMVWPPYGARCAREALEMYEGDLFLYAGEGDSGCTADDAFYDLLAAEWEQTSAAERHVTWSGIHCRLRAYHRKDGAR
ncbi:hypothetical protein D7231_32060 [Streptomyces klenkii]|uniref:Uncharacterized protein n=1 Tax=Streptomyces klenkii TaxID=1420899 RepID=A0A3B0AR93_9ACTN|nr:hypothetical protein [Streptomyces klenkii]RKN61907.1 hypothetical protein D7231_32060 [Streptomyces klenkii]